MDNARLGQKRFSENWSLDYTWETSVGEEVDVISGNMSIQL